MEMKGNNKGILLTLVTIVLLVLMTAELITYVYISINYETVSAFGALSIAGYRLTSSLGGAASSFIRASLYQSISTLSSYEGVSSRRNALLINNTAYALQSLMYNGFIYGTNEIPSMGGATIANFTNAITLQAKFEGLNLTITNSSLQVYQTSPYSVNATYTALAVVNSSSGVFTYPIVATSSAYINGSVDLYTVENNNNYIMQLQGSLPAASVVGNAYAISGSTSPFEFIYAPVIVENSIPTCSSVSSKFENANFILAVANDVAGSCGFGGVITYAASSSGYSVPYLVYNSVNSNVMGAIGNGTSLLLDGAGLSLLNISQLQGAVHGGYYYASGFSPSYLDWAQGSVGKRSQSGIFSFNLYNRLVPFVSSASSTSITIGNVFVTGLGSATTKHFSASLWFETPNAISSYSGAPLFWQGSGTTNVIELSLDNSKLVFGSLTGGCSAMNSINVGSIAQPNTWHNVVAVFNSSGQNTIYLDGIRVGSGIFSPCAESSGNFMIGGGTGGPIFNGYISNLQTYNISLTNLQATTLYRDGIEGIALSTKNLTGWWPLNGNINDYSGRGVPTSALSTNANGINYNYIQGYTGDPVYDGSFYSGNQTNIIEGVMSCANLSMCSNASLQQLYLGQTSLSAVSGIAQTEASALGLGNAVIPNVGSFNGNGYVLGDLSNSNYYSSGNPFSVSAWAYASASSSGPIVNIVGCAVPPITCSSTPIISIKGNTIYAQIGGTISYTVAPNTWHDIIVAYGGGVGTLYVDGINVGQSSVGYSGTSSSINYFATACGSSCTLPGGVSNTLNGKIGDVQFYQSALNAAQANQLVTNDMVIGIQPSDRWPLTTPYNGIANLTINTANVVNYGLFADNQGICVNANMINNLCGVSYTQP